MATATNLFTVWDYVVFAAVLAISAGIGVFYGCTGGKQKTTAEFLMADRQMSVLPVSLSLLASFMSAITLLGTPAEIYQYGTQYWLIWIGYFIMIPVAAHLFLPIFYNLKVTSVFEYLELRFCKGLRIFGAISYIIQTLLYMAIVLYTPSLALNTVTDLNVWISVVTVGLVCTFYTTIGGMKAVMWTDVFQTILMFGGLVLVLVKGSIDQGGFTNIWRYMEEGKRVEFFNLNPHPYERHSLWAVIFGGAFTWLAIYGVNQSQQQRAMCVPTLRQGQIALWINLPGLTALLTICALCGMVVYAQYRHCDPLLEGRIDAIDQILPRYVMDRLYIPGIPGLFTACLMSGALSTISSGLNSLSAVTLQDLLKTICFKELSEQRATNVSKILAFGFGIIMIGLAFVASQLGGVLQAALGLFGMIGGPMLGLYILGIVYPWANEKGGYAGVISGLVLTLWIGLGAQVYKPSVPKAPFSVSGCNQTDPFNFTSMALETSTLMDFDITTTAAIPAEEKAGWVSIYRLSYIWYSTFAVIVVNVVGLIVSFATGPNRPSEMDPRLFCPVLYNMCCCLPEGIRERLRCNVPRPDEGSEDGHGIGGQKADLGIINGYNNPTMEKDADDSFKSVPSSGSNILCETHL